MGLPFHYPRLKLCGETDRIYLQKQGDDDPFTFDAQVADVFDNMVVRSIPLYQSLNRMVVDWSHRFYQPDTKIFDVGCSTGTTLSNIGQTFAKPCHFVGIDSCAPMIAKAKTKLATLEKKHKIELLQQDAGTVDFTNASVVIINYILQFMPIEKKQSLLRKIFSGLNPGGIVIISEKLIPTSLPLREPIREIYEHYKETSGYSKSEIARKRKALETSMFLLSEKSLRKLMSDIGFSACECILKWNQFTSFVCLKQ